MSQLHSIKKWIKKCKMSDTYCRNACWLLIVDMVHNSFGIVLSTDFLLQIKIYTNSQYCVLRILTTTAQLLVTHSQVVIHLVKYVSRVIWNTLLISFQAACWCFVMTCVPCRATSSLSTTCAYLESFRACDMIR